MQVNYYLIPKHNPSNLDQKKKYYAVVDYNCKSTYRDLVGQISDYSTVNSPDIMAVLESLYMIIPKQLFEGKIVRLGELGSLRLILQSDGEEKQDDFTEFNIKGSKVRFFPSKKFMKKLKDIDYSKISNPNKPS